MAKYSKGAGKKVEESMHEFKRGKLKSGSGAKVKSRKQAIAIGLSEARERGAKVPKKKGAKKSAGKKAGRPKKASKRSTAKKSTKKSSGRTTKRHASGRGRKKAR